LSAQIIISYLLLGTATFLSLFRYKKVAGSPLVAIVYYLVIMFAVEMTAWFLIKYHYYNVWLYVLSSFFEVIVFFYVFYRYITNARVRLFSLLGIGLFVLAFFIEYLGFFKGWQSWPSFSLSLGYLVIVLMILYFFVEMFRSDKILFLHKYLVFWVALGVLFYLTISLPLNISLKLFIADGKLPGVYFLQFLANFVMYIHFIIGFIWNNKPYNL